jgi:hypothetical protein
MMQNLKGMNWNPGGFGDTAKHLFVKEAISVGILCIENKKNRTARTQSKPRCNLEDGSNEGMIETHP